MLFIVHVGSGPLIHRNYFFLHLAAGLRVCMNRVRDRDRDRVGVRVTVSTRLKIISG